MQNTDYFQAPIKYSNILTGSVFSRIDQIHKVLNAVKILSFCNVSYHKPFHKFCGIIENLKASVKKMFKMLDQQLFTSILWSSGPVIFWRRKSIFLFREIFLLVCEVPNELINIWSFERLNNQVVYHQSKTWRWKLEPYIVKWMRIMQPK